MSGVTFLPWPEAAAICLEPVAPERSNERTPPMTGYQISPRITLRPGDKFKVAGGPYYRLPSGERVSMAARGTYTLLAVEHGRRGRVQLLAYGPGGYAVLHVAGRRRSRVPGLVARPYRVRRAGRKDCRLDAGRADA